jgi:hypothetical protein
MSEAAGPLEYRQHYATDIEAMQTHLDGRQAQIHTAMPGHIVSYDPASMTVTVQIGLQALREMTDGSIQPVTIQPIRNVPVMFPTGGGHTLTFPIKPGDECLVIFTERSIDNWYQHGGLQQPNDYRMHDINDALCFVGIRSQPNVLGGGAATHAGVATTASADTVQLRSDDGQTYIELDGAGRTVNIRCPGVITLDCVSLHVTGDIQCYSEVFAQSQTMGFVTLSKHFKHSGSPSTPTPGT